MDFIRFLELLISCYQECSGELISMLSILKRYAGDTVSIAIQQGHLQLPNSISLTTGVGKQLHEDAACLRRIKRLGPWEDEKQYPPNGKVIIMSGKLMFTFYIN